jgi:hypothetical protein
MLVLSFQPRTIPISATMSQPLHHRRLLKLQDARIILWTRQQDSTSLQNIQSYGGGNSALPDKPHTLQPLARSRGSQANFFLSYPPDVVEARRRFFHSVENTKRTNSQSGTRPGLGTKKPGDTTGDTIHHGTGPFQVQRRRVAPSLPANLNKEVVSESNRSMILSEDKRIASQNNCSRTS